MHKDFMPPVSVEEFAAYLDHNLPDDKMNAIDNLVFSNDDLTNLLGMVDEVDMAIWQNTEMPEDIANIEFNLPECEVTDFANDNGTIESDSVFNFDGNEDENNDLSIGDEWPDNNGQVGNVGENPQDLDDGSIMLDWELF